MNPYNNVSLESNIWEGYTSHNYKPSNNVSPSWLGEWLGQLIEYAVMWDGGQEQNMPIESSYTQCHRSKILPRPWPGLPPSPKFPQA